MHNSDGTSQQTHFDLKVTDAPLTAKPVSISAVATVAFSGAVATFSSPRSSKRSAASGIDEHQE
jgi:hypothetical protein